ncbi:hypothetical protein [Kitasatospora sp. NPDC005856]|uniref:hypothetical protein n=1 Tax=Kitasatospora sp. NPDC005856 TaxID=3154566 RepID=UPI00340892FC
MNIELPFPISAEIKGITQATTFNSLSGALDAIRAGLARLPLDDDQAGCLADRFGEAAVARIAHQLVEFGAVRAMAFIGVESTHPIYLRVADPE